MKRAPKAPLILVALLCFAGLLKATLPQTMIGKWTAAIGLSQPRANAASVILPDGRILIIGGDGGSGSLQSVEVFGTEGSVSPAAAMNTPRSQHFAVVLSDGRVLVGGGVSSGGGTTNSAEIYDSSADTWTKTSVMAEARANATAALLQDGRVLIAGGDNSGSSSNTLEIFDPSNGSFAFAGTLSAARTKQAMAVLQDGRVLIVGGSDGTNPLASTDIFDPSSGSVSAGPTLATARYSASATTLLNGQVAVIGGAGSDGNGGTTDLASAEIFDPSTGAFITAGVTLTTAREAHQAYLLPKNNSVLIVGGTSSGSTVAASELFTPQASPSSGAWTYAIATTGSNATPRSAATGSAMQQDGLLLAAGGTDASGNTLASTELYAFPTVKTDQADYPPGTTVNITGRGFTPGEAVTITLVESPLFDTHGPYTVTADGNGNVSDSSFTTDIHDVNVRFWLSATGSQSGLVAQNTFTDSKPNTVTVGPQQTNPIAPGGSTQYTVTVNFNGNSASCTSPLSVSAGLPTGATASFSPSSVTSTGGNAASTLTVSTTNSTPPGLATFTVLAANGGGTCQTGTASGTGTLTVVENTTTTITSSQNPTVFGQSTTLKATVAQTVGSTTPTGGTVTFLDGANTIGTATLSNGTATLPISTLSTGSHSLTASYAGVANTFGASTSSAITQAVNQASTTTTVVSSASTSNFGQSVTFTATVAAVSPGAGNATGMVTFTDGTTTLGTGTLSTTGGVTTATFTTSTLAVGSHSINASYGGDTNFTSSATTTALTQTVTTASTTTTVASSANPAVAGQVITLTATVTPSGGGAPTGSVTFKDSGMTFGSGTLSTTGGVTTATVSVIQSVGSHSITASYGGDTNFSGSTSSVLTQTVNKANTTTTLASAPNPSAFDSPVTFTVTVAAVAPGAGGPSGTVTLTMGNTVEGTGTLSTSGAVTTATIVVSSLPVGSNGLKASYAGDSNFNASSTPNALSQTVTTAPTTTTLASSVNPSVFGQSVTFTATVSVNAPSTGTIPAAETVTFKDNGTTIGTGTTNASGVATLTTSSLTAATHPITATYSGDTNFATSTSSAVSQVVNPAPTTTALTSATNPSVFGQTVTFTATVTVSSPGAGAIPAGETVTFRDGPNTLGTGLTNASGVATFTTSALTAATHSVTAVYAGDTSFATSTSSAVSQVVYQASTTTTVTSSVNPSSLGQSVTFTATVAAVAPGSGNPTGTVTFKDGANAIGTGTLSTTAGVTTAMFSTSALTSGSHSITAVYGSDTNFSGSTSSALTQNVLSPPSILKAFGAATIPLNGTTSLTFTITNPAGNTVALNGLAFTDTLPAGMVVATPNGLSSTCGGTPTAVAGSGSVSLSGGTVAASSSCSISVNVTGTSVGQKNNTTGAVSSTNGGTGNTASAGIIVDAPPTISKAFGAAQINLNTSTSLTFTITNPNATSLSGIAFSDSLPSGLVVASPAGLTGSCGSGTISSTAGSSLVALSGGTLGASGQCVFSVNVTGTSTGAKLNTTGAITSAEGGTGVTSNTATLNVVGTPPTITSGNGATFTAGIANSFTVATSGTPTASLSFSGTLPTGVGFTDNGNGTATISGTATTSGNYPITITAQNGVPPNATQTFTLMVNAGALATITVSPANAAITAGGNESYAAAGFDKFGNSIGDVTGATTFTVTGGTCLSNSCSSTLAGTQTVTGNDGGIIGSAMLNVMPGAITHLALSPATASITAGGSQSYTALGLDIYNNGAGDVTSLTTFTIGPAGSCTGASCTSNVAGTEMVTGTYTNGSQGTATLTVTAGSFTHLQLLAPGETAAPGTATGKIETPNVEYVNGPFNVTANAVDQFFNVVSGVSDTVHFASNDTDPKTKLPSDAALVNGTGTFSITLETVSYNPNKTTITATDVTNNSITSDTSPAIEVIVVYTASITPTMAGTGDATTYTLTVNNAQAPNTNNLASVQIAVPSADQGTVTGVSVVAPNGGPPLTWNKDLSKPEMLRFFANGDADAVTPGGTITITFTATSNATVSTVPVSEQWITNGFSDAASNNGLPLAGPEPTVQIGAAPKIISGNTATFTFGTPGTSFTVTTTGVPLPTVSESGSLAPGLSFTANSDGTATISGTPTAAGSYPITITAHSGFGPDATQTLTIVVNKADSVSTVVSSAEPSVFGQSVTFTATVSAVSPATGTPTGMVTFFADGTTQIGAPQTLNAFGKASLNTSTLAVASHSITAVYSGDNNFNKTGEGTSNAIAFTQDVDKADTNSTVVSSVNPSVFGQSVTFTATVAAVAPGAGTPTGTVQFMDGANSLGSPMALSGGQASLSTSSLSVASHYIKAVYSGDGNFNVTGFDAGSTATPVTQVVNKADSSSVTASSVNPSVFGQSVTFTATVIAVAPGTGTPTGTVDFKDGANTIASGVMLSGGSATFTTSSLSVASHYIKAVYSGDGNFNGTGMGASTATPISQVVNKADSTSTVVSSLNSSTFGQSVTFTATVTAVAPGTGTPGGTVTFMDGSGALGPAVSLASGVATFSTSSLNATTHSITAVYSGDSNFNATNFDAASTANTLAQVVNKADAVIKVTPYNITYDGNSHSAGGTATGVFNETLSGLDLSGTTHTNAGTYYDKWVFTDVTGNYNNATATITDVISQASAVIVVNGFSGMYDANSHGATGNAVGVETPTPADLNALLHLGASFTAVPGGTANWSFDGNNNYKAASGSVAITITPAPSVTTVMFEAGPYTYRGTPFTAAATASGIGGLNVNVLPVMYSGDCKNVTAGGCTATATFAGDQNHTGSMGMASIVITPASTSTTVASSPNPSNWTNVVTLTANVVNSSGTNVQPVGSVYFYNNAPSGSSCNTLLASATSPIGIGAVTGVTDTTVTNYLNMSTATIVTPSLPTGTDTILACYNYNPADMTYTANFNVSSGTTSQTVNPAPIITLVPTSLSFGTQAAGTKSGVQSVTICNGPSAGTCAGVPTATAALSISSIAFGGNNPGDFIFTTSPANNCGGGIANGGSCVVNVQFAPQSNSSGVESAFLNLTDNDVNIVGSVQSASVTGAGLSVIGPVAGSFSTYAIAATNNNCSAVNISGNGTVDSFNGATNSGNVAINGNASLNGGPVINGTLYSLFGTTGSCSSKSMTGATITGKAQITGGEKLLSGALNFALPTTFSGVTTSWNITSCPSGLTGCFNTGTKTVSLTPGQYGNLTISGGTVAHVSAGTYNINSLTLTGNSVLYVDSGPVVINLSGTGLSANSAVLDSSGGSILNSTGKTSNLGIYYGGSNVMKLSGGSGTYALVYAPNAAVSMTGGSHFYGSIVANTVNSSGNTAIHGDLGAASIADGNTLWLSSSGLKVQGLPSNQTVKLYVTNASVTYTANGSNLTTPVPNAVITFSPTATSASTTWDAANSRWSTLVPTSSVSGNSTIHTFFDAVAIPVPTGGFPNGIQNVSLQAAYSTTSTGFTFSWQWGAAVYSGTMPAAGDYSTFNVNPLDSTVPAGTPVAYESSLLFGDMGPGYVGMYEGSTSVVPTIAPASIAPSSWNFGTVSKSQTGMLTQSFTLSNNQSGLLTMSSTMNPPIVISGTNAADFSWTSNCPASGATMPGGSSCTINITYTVSSTGGLLEKAKLSVYNNAANSPQTVFLQATGAP